MGHVYVQHGGWERNGSYSLSYHEYYVPNDVQLEDEEAFTYGDSLTARAATTVSWEAAKIVGTYKMDGDLVEHGEGADVPEVANYVIFSEIPET